MEISQEAIEASLVAVLSVLLHISISGLQWIRSHFILLYYRLLKFLDQEIVIIWSQSLRLHVYSRLECSPYATPGHLNFWTFIRLISRPPRQKLRLRSPTHVVELSKVTFKHLLEVTMNCYLIFSSYNGCHTTNSICPKTGEAQRWNWKKNTFATFYFLFFDRYTSLTRSTQERINYLINMKRSREA